jgi:hypothetical protein
MRTINYILEGFGFQNLTDYKMSTFGYFLTTKVISISLIIGTVKTFLLDYLGFDLLVFSAFVLLNILEFSTGVRASKKRKEKVESRKMGRMFLKVGTYLLIIYILNSFKNGLQFPAIMDFELDPFIIFYWAFLAGTIYQLLKSLLENMVALGYAEANGVLGFIVRKFNTYFEDEGNSNE